ncbi:MAG: carbohydrate ABC transporter substrate-binding protein [Oscillospiraceae bacterium]|nr:carbohydrate ABC transporter substrate-binding protein [Oscillospiraceae bacterium]
MKRAKAALIWLLTALLLCSCAVRETEIAPEPEGFAPALGRDTAGSVTIYGDIADFSALLEAFEDFRAYYPAIELRYVKLDDYKSAVVSALDGENAPDIYFVHGWMRGQQRYRTVFDHAENLASPALSISLDCIRSRLLTYDGEELSAVPVLSSAYGMLVNRSLFEKFGLSVPESFDALREVCEDFKAGGVSSPLCGYTGAGNGSAFYIAAYARLCGLVSGDERAIEELNALSAEGGERLRAVFERVEELSELLDVTASESIMDNHTAVIERFFEGNTPMMIAAAETLTATRLYPEPDFDYAFYPLPVSDKDAVFLDLAAVSLAVNKESGSLKLANEFVRFLTSEDELVKLAERSALIPVTVERPESGVYAPFATIPDRRSVTPEDVNITEEVSLQLRVLAQRVGLGLMTVDEAASAYGKVVT